MLRRRPHRLAPAAPGFIILSETVFNAAALEVQSRRYHVVGDVWSGCLILLPTRILVPSRDSTGYQSLLISRRHHETHIVRSVLDFCVIAQPASPGDCAPVAGENVLDIEADELRQRAQIADEIDYCNASGPASNPRECANIALDLKD
jgi:hypothetical protein